MTGPWLKYILLLCAIQLSRQTTAAPPPLLLPSCSLLPSPGGVNISLQWSPSFTSQYAVERYRVSVNPDPSSCSSDHVSPSEDYSCSGLVLGTHYTFTVSAINYGDQEGERNDINITLQAPEGPLNVEVTPQYLIKNRSTHLSRVLVKWDDVLQPAEQCTYSPTLLYNLTFLTNNHTSVVQTLVPNSECELGLCSFAYEEREVGTYFTRNSSGPLNLSVSACNVFGCWTENTYGHDLQPSNISLSVTSEDCMTFVTCSTPTISSSSSRGWCVVQYTTSSSYRSLSAPLTIPLNSRQVLARLESSTTYYLQAMVTVSSGGVNNTAVYRKSFTTEKLSLVHRLSVTNQGLVSAGVVALLLVFIVLIFFLVLASQVTKKSKVTDSSVKLPVLPVMVICMLMLVAVVLWVTATGLWITIIAPYVGQQQETCAEEWQATKDNYIIAACFLSLLSLVLVIPALLITCITKYSSSRKFSFFSSGNSEYTQL